MYRFVVLGLVLMSSSSCAVVAGSLVALRAVDEEEQYQHKADAEARYRVESAVEAAEVRRRWNAANPKVEGGPAALTTPPLVAVEPLRQPLRPKFVTR